MVIHPLLNSLQYTIGKTGPKHHFHSKAKLKNPVADNPGPNHYSVTDCRSSLKLASSYSIPKARIRTPKVSPGPATYEPDRKLIKHNWKKGIKIFEQKRMTEFQAKEITETFTPGPASYSSKSLFPNSGVISREKSPSYSFGNTPRDPVHGSTPGPGEYNTQTKDDIGKRKSSRQSYTKALRNTLKSLLASQKRNVTTPSPERYTPVHDNILTKNPGYSIGK